jgi:hypothetical protein
LKDYNLTDKEIIKKQIDILNEYKLSGLAMYYYWFSTNTCTNKSTIMEKVINLFFEMNITNLKIFFIWANESWTKNPAFGNSDNVISNEYTKQNIEKNVNHLMKYFKHKNYLKIENKPVFFVYHAFTMTDNEIELLYNILNEKCILNGFSGIHIALNSFSESNSKYKNFYINFNYKNDDSRYRDYNKSINLLDYKKYINNELNSSENIQTIAFDFDNRARLFKPDRLEFSTVCINNTEINKTIFMNKIIEKYKNKTNEIDKILLINAFNEWGEKMHFEPSNKYGYYNLNLLSSCLYY